jgi:glycosyltransferase involved in cell wall biosynthesis
MPTIVKALPEANLLLLGDGPERLRLEKLAAELGIRDRLKILGVTEGIAPYIAGADVLVAPSRNEGMGRAIVEAMSLGLPVVAAKVGGIPDVVVDGQCGRLVSPDDSDALAATLLELLTEPTKRTKYGLNGQERAERFSRRQMESKLLQLYRELATEKGLPVPESDVSTAGKMNQ